MVCAFSYLGPSVAARTNSGLICDAQSRGAVLVPPTERALQTVTAEAFFKVSNNDCILEGPSFDSNGNLLFCEVTNHRMLVFNKNGRPIGQILLPDREQGHNLQSTSLAIRAGTNDLYIVSNDGENSQGAAILHARAFAKGLTRN